MAHGKNPQLRPMEERQAARSTSPQTPDEWVDSIESALSASMLEVLTRGSGPALAEAVSNAELTFDELQALGLPRRDVFAELAMLYRDDCPVEFLRGSQFRLQAMKDPVLPIEVALRVLSDRPAAHEIEALSARPDVPPEALATAARDGLRRARPGGGWSFLRLSVLPTPELGRALDRQDTEQLAILEHPRCPEDVVLRLLLSRAARVRYAALRAVHDRNLAIDSALIRLAARLPMSETRRSVITYAPRVRALADQILEAR